MIKALEENKFVDILVGKFEESDVADEINSLDFNDAYEEVFNWVVENYQDGDNQFWSDTATNLMDEFYENGNEERKINESYEHSNRSLVKNYIESCRNNSKNKIREGLDDSERTDLSSVLNSISQLKYKLNHYLSGNCYGTTQELQEYLKDLSSQLEEIWANIVNEISD